MFGRWRRARFSSACGRALTDLINYKLNHAIFRQEVCPAVHKSCDRAQNERYSLLLWSWPNLHSPPCRTALHHLIEFAAAAATGIPVAKVNAGDTANAPLVERYGVEQYPALFVFKRVYDTVGHLPQLVIRAQDSAALKLHCGSMKDLHQESWNASSLALQMCWSSMCA